MKIFGIASLTLLTVLFTAQTGCGGICGGNIPLGNADNSLSNASCPGGEAIEGPTSVFGDIDENLLPRKIGDLDPNITPDTSKLQGTWNLISQSLAQGEGNLKPTVFEGSYKITIDGENFTTEATNFRTKAGELDRIFTDRTTWEVSLKDELDKLVTTVECGDQCGTDNLVREPYPILHENGQLSLILFTANFRAHLLFKRQ